MTDTATPAGDNLESMTVKALRELASTHFPQIKGISGLNKAPLIAAIQEAMNGTATQPAPSVSASAKAPAKSAGKTAGKTPKAPEKSTPVSIPAFAKDACPATTRSGQAKAERKFLRDVKHCANDNATRAAVRKQMKRLKKRTRREGKAAGKPESPSNTQE